MNEREMFHRFMTAMMRDEKVERKPKHYGFGLPSSYRVIDVETGTIVSSFGHSEVAIETATEKSAETGHRFEICAIWR